MIALARAAQVRPEWLLVGSGPMLAEDHKYYAHQVTSAVDDVAFLPLFYAPHPKPSGGASLEDCAEVVDYLPFKRNWLKQHTSTDPEHIALLHVTGDAMEPLLRDREVVFVDRTQNLRLGRSTLKIVSDHKSYGQIDMPISDVATRLRLVGRVFGNIQHIF